jgi:hypothetical protein
MFFPSSSGRVFAVILENVTATGCFIYGDYDTPASAKKQAFVMAKRNAVESHSF